MPVFDVSFLNPKTRKQDYGYLVDQLSIKQNQLEADGKLSPGDYQLLVKEGQKLYSHPGLTADQRSNIQVKISNWESLAKTTALKSNQDIKALNNGVADDNAKLSMYYGNKPDVLLKGKADALNLKLDSLSQSIDQLQGAGDDASAHILEFNQTLNDYNDTLQALSDVKSHKAGTPASSDFAAYLKTNSQGEITDVSVERVGSKTGYTETNGLYGGLPIYGKINRKEDGKNVFILGNDKFSAPDLMIPDPQNPGSMKSSKLISETQKKTLGGGFVTATAGQYKEVDLNQVRTQQGVRTGGWLEGSKGFLYQKNSDGSYTKYTNAKKDSLGISENDIIRAPKFLEDSILPSVSKTVDGNQSMTLPPAPIATPMTSTSTPSSTPTTTTPTSGATSRTPSPTVRAPQTSQGLGSKIMQGAKNFLSSLGL